MTTQSQTAPDSRAGWSLVGPGLIVAATGVGAADLVATVIAGQRFGYALLWAVIVGCLMKVVLVEGAGRYSLATGNFGFGREWILEHVASLIKHSEVLKLQTKFSDLSEQIRTRIPRSRKHLCISKPSVDSQCFYRHMLHPKPNIRFLRKLCIQIN